VEWAPNGLSLLVQPSTDVPQESCRPRLWLYDLLTTSWSEVAKPPEDGPRYLDLMWFDWSPDGRWVVWKSTERLLVYDANTWGFVREIRLEANQSWLPWSWVKDSAGNFILAIREHDFAHPPKKYILLGLSPNGTAQDDKVIVQITREPDWLPRNTNIDYVPLLWEP
jgi:hypothetical protein